LGDAKEFLNQSVKTRILHLNLHREFFAAVAAGKKRIEYRRRTAYWRRRLEGRQYDVIQFRNGYATLAPVMVVEFCGLRRYGIARAGYYAIRLGRVLSLRRWHN
jgi:ASC-1-like (ASCH) protein